MAQMDLFCVILFCVGTSVTLATLDQRIPVEEEPASSPLIQHLIERVDALERQGVKQTSEIQFLRAEMSQQASEIQTLRTEMSRQASEIQTLRAEMSRQASEIQTLRAEVSQQASEIQTLRAEMSQQASEIQTLRAEMSQQASEIHTLKAEMSQQKAFMRQLPSKVHSKDKLIQTLLNKVSKIINNDDVPFDSGETPANSMMVSVAEGSKHRQQRRSPVNRIVPVEYVPVAFTASFNRTQAQSTQSTVTDRRVHIPIVFDIVETNVGNGYNPTNGSFIAPVSGIYVFSAFLLSSSGSATHDYIKVNTHEKACIYMKGDHEMAGQTMVLQLSQGDNVVIVTAYLEGLYGHTPNSYTTFSGFLLYQTYTGYKGGPLFG